MWIIQWLPHRAVVWIKCDDKYNILVNSKQIVRLQSMVEILLLLLTIILIIFTFYLDIFSLSLSLSLSSMKTSQKAEVLLWHILSDLHWASCPILRCSCLTNVYRSFHTSFAFSINRHFYFKDYVPGIAARNRAILYMVVVQSHLIMLLIYSSNIPTNLSSHIVICTHCALGRNRTLASWPLPSRSPKSNISFVLVMCSAFG